MTSSELIQIATGLIGSLCFGILFNMRGKRLIAAAVGGLLSFVMFVVLSHFILNEPINYFIVAAVVSLYSEIMARILKTPAAPIVTTSLIPLIPGGSLYYTMSSAFESNFTMFLEKAVSTLKLACALALGIIVVTAISQFLFKRVKQR
ncbi:MAG: threonine/serine exporter family protein [Oscillospiraceae bacterium]|nr:threonine/serine exporter family protein [Oscillospiraceae bacterium]